MFDLGPDPELLGIGAKEYVATNLAKSLHLTRPARLDIIGVIMCGGQIAALLTGQDRLGHGLALLPKHRLYRPGLAIALAGKAELATRARRALEHDLTDGVGPADLAGAIKHDLGHGHLARTRLAPRLIIYGLGQAFQIAGAGTNGTAAKTHAPDRWRGQLAIAILYGAVLVQPRRKQVQTTLAIRRVRRRGCGMGAGGRGHTKRGGTNKRPTGQAAGRGPDPWR